MVLIPTPFCVCVYEGKSRKAEDSQMLNTPIKIDQMIDTSKHKCQVLEDVKDQICCQGGEMGLSRDCLQAKEDACRGN